MMLPSLKPCAFVAFLVAIALRHIVGHESDGNRALRRRPSGRGRVLSVQSLILATVASAAAALSSAAPSAGSLLDLAAWVGAGSVRPGAVEVRRGAFGLGVFAARALAPGEVLAEVPLARCLSARDALADVDLGAPAHAFFAANAGDAHAAGVALAALLALRRHRGGDAYVDSLPWGAGGGAGAEATVGLAGESNSGGGGGGGKDPLAAHALVAAHTSSDASVVGDARLTQARRSALAARALLEASGDGAAARGPEAEARCFRAVVLVASRAFDFSAAAELAALRAGAPGAVEYQQFVMVPFLDLFNHPSLSAMGAAGEGAAARFASATVKHACVSATANYSQDSDGKGGGGGGAVTVRAPTCEGCVAAGDELWNWYGNAGYGAPSSEARAKEEREFRCSYGFSPWE